MANHIAAQRRALVRNGLSITLKRVLTGVAPVSVTCLAFMRDYAPHEIAGELMTGDREIIIGNEEIATASWPAPPAKDDRVTIGTEVLTVQKCETVRIGSIVARYKIVARG